MYDVGEVLPNLDPPILLFGLLRTKPPNLKNSNISGYTVYTLALSSNRCLWVTVRYAQKIKQNVYTFTNDCFNCG